MNPYRQTVGDCSRTIPRCRGLTRIADDPASSEDEVHDAPCVLISKGRHFSMAAAPNHQFNEPFDELRRDPRLRASDESWILKITAASQSVISDDQDQFGDANATNVNGMFVDL